jgi:hypothetical protein
MRQKSAQQTCGNREAQIQLAIHKKSLFVVAPTDWNISCLSCWNGCYVGWSGEFHTSI